MDENRKAFGIFVWRQPKEILSQVRKRARRTSFGRRRISLCIRHPGGSARACAKAPLIGSSTRMANRKYISLLVTSTI